MASDKPAAGNGNFTRHNRTGAMTSPELTRESIEGAQKGRPTSQGNADAMAAPLSTYSDAQGALGSQPQAPTASGAKGGTQTLTVLFDLLGDRIAFERGGARLYESLIRKAQLAGIGADIVKDLEHIYREELAHFTMLEAMITRLGGDATVQTPSADVSGVIAHGVMQVVADPRTTFVQCLHAILSAELTDNDGWQMLKDFFAAQGYTEQAQQCAQALAEEQEHLVKVRAWIKALLQTEAAPAATKH